MAPLNDLPSRTINLLSALSPRQNAPLATVTVINTDGDRGNNDNDSLDGGAIAGIVIGSIIGFILLCWLIKWAIANNSGGGNSAKGTPVVYEEPRRHSSRHRHHHHYDYEERRPRSHGRRSVEMRTTSVHRVPSPAAVYVTDTRRHSHSRGRSR